MSYTVNMDYLASRPGKMHISAGRYLDYKGITGLKRIYYPFLMALPKGIAFKLMKSSDIMQDWVQMQEHFLYGCINPTVVVDTEKSIIATYTDLSRNQTEAPYIKISEARLDLVKGIKLYDGLRLPSVALYRGDLNDHKAKEWDDFNPLLPHCFSNNRSAIRKALNSIPDTDWERLESGIAIMGDSKYDPGFYRIGFE